MKFVKKVDAFENNAYYLLIARLLKQIKFSIISMVI